MESERAQKGGPGVDGHLPGPGSTQELGEALMQRIIEGILYEGQEVPGSYVVTTKACGRVRERIVRPYVAWSEVGAVVPYVPEDAEAEARDALAEKQKNLRRAARRARQVLKWFIIGEGFDELLTITYRENMTDVATMKRHFEEWVRRMKRALPGFRYGAGFEPQERGAWHIHVATHKLPQHAEYKGVKIAAWRLGTEIWRSIVGADNGLCFVGGKASRWGKARRRNMGLYKMAAYVSKYVTKHYELCPEEKNRYSRSNGAREVTREEIHLAGCHSLAELVAGVFEVLECETIVGHRVAAADGFYLLATELGTDPGGG